MPLEQIHNSKKTNEESKWLLVTVMANCSALGESDGGGATIEPVLMDTVFMSQAS